MTLVHRIAMFAAAGAVALTGFTAAPARANDAGLIAALAGIAALAIIIDDNNGRDRNRSYNARRYNDYGHDRYERRGRHGDRHYNGGHDRRRFSRGDHYSR